MCSLNILSSTLKSQFPSTMHACMYSTSVLPIPCPTFVQVFFTLAGKSRDRTDKYHKENCKTGYDFTVMGKRLRRVLTIVRARVAKIP